MKKEKKGLATIIALLTFALLFSVGTTLAFLTDVDQAKNTIVLGNVQIELQPAHMDMGQLEPGSPVNFEPYVKNIGRNDCFVKIEIVLSDTELLDQIKIVQLDSHWTDINTTDFYSTGRATLYYDALLTGEASGNPELTTPAISFIDLSDDYLEQSGDEFNISVIAVAIQSRYKGSTATTAEQAFGEFNM